MAVGEVSNEPSFSLATLPPRLRQRRSALAASAVLLVTFAVTAPFWSIPLTPVSALIPAIEGIFSLSDLITAVLLFSQFSIIRSRALLVLASGYLFTALIVIPHALTYPGVFSPTGLLGAGLQSTIWLYSFWHFGFAAAVIGYALLKDADHKNKVTQVSTQSAIGWSVVIVTCLVCGLTGLATAGDEYLPRLFLDRARITPLEPPVMTLNLLACALALVLLWSRRRSLLDEWLVVVACALTGELGLILFSTVRFSFGFYEGRIFTLVTSTTVLVIFLTETTKLYTRLARANMALQRERQNKLMNLEAMAASISHEVRQPLAAIATNSGAAARFLDQLPPNNEEVRLALNRIASDSHRASQVFDNMRALFGRSDQKNEPIDVNEIALAVLRILRTELKERGIIARADVTPALPLVMGNSGQLQEVILNLARNAIEAMDSIKDGSRVLVVKTERNDPDAITVAVEDTGPGIEAGKFEDIFGAFVTTKPQGTGLGLAICRMIVDRHGGQLLAWSDKKKGGALFQFTLPVKTAAASTATPI